MLARQLSSTWNWAVCTSYRYHCPFSGTGNLNTRPGNIRVHSQDHFAGNHHPTNRGIRKNLISVSSSTPWLDQQPWSVPTHQLWLPLQTLRAGSMMTWELPLAGTQRKNLFILSDFNAWVNYTLWPICLGYFGTEKGMKKNDACWSFAVTMVSVSAMPLTPSLGTRSPGDTPDLSIGTRRTWFSPAAPV